MPPECHRHAPPTGGNEGGADRERVIARGDRQFDAVRERKRALVTVDRRATMCRRAPHYLLIDPPTGLADEQAVDRETVVVGAESQAAEVDRAASGTVTTRGEPIGPRRE